MNGKMSSSGSTIFSSKELLDELFWDDVTHIEIGEFSSYEDFEYFLELINRKTEMSYGVHSPLLRGKSKYDLIEAINYDTEEAWDNLESEMAMLANLGAEYLLVHFPYFNNIAQSNPNTLIEQGLIKMERLQKKYNLNIICEPKLGSLRSVIGINYLHNFPVETWAKYNIGICIDIGDYIMATKEKFFEYVKKWNKFIRVVHLHNIIYIKDKYVWIPIHPSNDSNNIRSILQYFSVFNDIIYVFEHTPETNPSESFVVEGCKWAKEILQLEQSV